MCTSPITRCGYIAFFSMVLIKIEQQGHDMNL